MKNNELDYKIIVRYNGKQLKHKGKLKNDLKYILDAFFYSSLGKEQLVEDKKWIDDNAV
jgi:hypothetical protein